ncbi:MAG: hypothetical protein R2761_29585 [Acidimicrobiales bacterium]
MATEWRWYLGNRDYYLRDKTEELASRLAAAASRERSERYRLAKQQGTLEERLNRLADDVHRLVELSDLRDELDFFADNEAVRRRVRTALVAMELLGPSGRPMAPPSAIDLRDDTADYWLGPATRSLPRVLGGAEPELDPDVVEARRRDPERTDRFLALVLTLTGDGARAGALVPALLGPVPGGQVSTVQRALWLAAASGSFGPDARTAVADWLARQTPASPEAPAGSSERSSADAERWAARAQPLGPDPTHTALLKRLPGPVARVYEGPLRAAWGLEALMAQRSAAFAAWSEPPAGTGIDDAIRARLQGALVAVVDEGAPAEAPLLRRAEALRRQLRTEGEAAAGSGPELPDPDAPAGRLTDLLLDDALPPPATPPTSANPVGASPPTPSPRVEAAAPGPLAALAWQAGAAALAPVVRSLARAAARLPSAVEPFEMTVGPQVLRIGPHPLAPGEAERAAQAAAEASYPVPGGLLGRLKDDEHADARQNEKQRHLSRIEAVVAALAALRAEVDRLRDLPAAAEEALGGEAGRFSAR